MTYFELLYRIWNRLGEREGKAAYLRLKALPVRRVDLSEDLLVSAARIKATQDLSVADSWIAATARQTASRLVHKEILFGQPQSGPGRASGHKSRSGRCRLRSFEGLARRRRR